MKPMLEGINIAMKGPWHLIRKYMNLDDIVRLWHKTQMGNYKECQKHQEIFADIMWTLYEKQKEKE